MKKIDLKSNLKAEIGSENSECYLVIYDFVRFSDDSSVMFKINIQNSVFGIHNFKFFAGINSFKLFLGKVESIFGNLNGKAEILVDYEKSYIMFEGKNNGHIDIITEVHLYDGTDQMANVQIIIDQTFLPSFIKSLKQIYKDLNF